MHIEIILLSQINPGTPSFMVYLFWIEPAMAMYYNQGKAVRFRLRSMWLPVVLSFQGISFYSRFGDSFKNENVLARSQIFCLLKRSISL